MYACNGILFNHESERRGETFVTRKITREMARIATGLKDCLYLGNLDASRDWGHARDYVEMQWLMLQQDEPRDFVIATGQQISVREFVNKTAERLKIEIEWTGRSETETGTVRSVEGKSADYLSAGDVIVRVDPRYFRPAEVETLLGDPTLAKDELGWVPTTALDEMVDEMVGHDLDQANRVRILKERGFHVSLDQE